MSAEVVLCDDIKNIDNIEFGIKWTHVLEIRELEPIGVISKTGRIYWFNDDLCYVETYDELYPVYSNKIKETLRHKHGKCVSFYNSHNIALL